MTDQKTNILTPEDLVLFLGAPVFIRLDTGEWFTPDRVLDLHLLCSLSSHISEGRVKPVLKRFSGLTELERSTVAMLEEKNLSDFNYIEDCEFMHLRSKTLVYLLRQNIDVFGYITRGLAIEKGKEPKH